MFNVLYNQCNTSTVMDAANTQNRFTAGRFSPCEAGLIIMKNNSILRCVENGVEYFTVVKTGESGLSTSGMARSLGVTHSSVTRVRQKVEKTVVRDSLPKSLQPLFGTDLILVRNSNEYKNVTIYTANAWAGFSEYYAFDAKPTTEEAREVMRATSRIGANSYIQGKTGWLPDEFQFSHQEREQLNRILNKRCPWEKMYDKDMCDKGFAWFGSQFYWDYFYFWMTPEERCKLNVVNPLKKGKRKDKIHQWIEPETKERLRPRAVEMCLLLSMSQNKEQFERHYQAAYGDGWQQEMF